MARDQDIGKWFERKVWAGAGQQFPYFLDRHRFLDAAACGNTAVNKAPADFEFAFQGRTYLVECKASRVKESLRSVFSSAVEDHQVDALQRRRLTGNQGFILFYSELIDWVQFWPSSLIIDARYNKKRLPKTAPFEFELGELERGDALLRCFWKADLDLHHKLEGVNYSNLGDNIV